MERIKKILKISYEMSLKDFDNLFLIVGKEGVGKSHLMLNCIEEWVKINPDDEIDIDRIGLNATEFIHALKNSKVGQYVVFDEAGDGLYSREGMSPLNKGIVKVYMVARGKRLLTFLVLPSFFDIDTYFRKHRVRGLFYVYKRGRCVFYNKRQIEKIIDKCEKARKIFGVKESFRDTFPKYKGELLQEYEKKKKKKIKDSIDKLYKDFVIEKKGMLTCPSCGANDVRYRSKTKDIMCKKCGEVFQKKEREHYNTMEKKSEGVHAESKE